MERVAVIGAGMMGHGLVQIFAAKGHDVMLNDVNDDLLSKALANVRTNMAFLSDNGLGSEEETELTLARIRTTQSLKIEKIKLPVKWDELVKRYDDIVPHYSRY